MRLVVSSTLTRRIKQTQQTIKVYCELFGHFAVKTSTGSRDASRDFKSVASTDSAIAPNKMVLGKG